MKKNSAKSVLNVVNQKTGKSVKEQDVKKLASKVKPSTLSNDAELRRLIKQVSAMANIPVSEGTINEIINAVKKSGGNANNMQQLIKIMMGKH